MIKKQLTLLLLLLFCVSTISIAQQKKYITYTVKEGETLKSIAKQFDMSRRDLSRLNPGVSKKPSANTVIVVPNVNFGKKEIETTDDDSNYIVKAKETLFGISKKFNVSIEALKEANPSLENGLKVGMILIIPESETLIAVDSVNFVVHKVVKDDTLYSLTRRFEVSENELFELNPELENGLKLGMILKIKPREEEISTDEFVENFENSSPIKVAVMLPYQLQKFNDSLLVEGFKKKNSLLNITTEVHQGIQKAIDSLHSKGLSISVSYFDTENSKYKLQYLVNSYEVKQSDIVIGPLFYENALWVSNRIQKPVIIPFYSKKQDTLSSRQLIKTSPNLKSYEDKLLSYLEKEYDGENVVVINDDKPQNQPKLWKFVSTIKKFESLTKVEVIKPSKGYIPQEVFDKKLDTLGGKNWVIILSDDVVTTASAVNNLKTYTQDVDIKLFALQKGRNFENIDNLFLARLEFVYPTSEYEFLNNYRFEQFYNSYYKDYEVYPSTYAIRGFDVTYDILSRLATEKNFDKALTKHFSKRVVSVFDFEKDDSGGYENKDLLLVKFLNELVPEIIEE